MRRTSIALTLLLVLLSAALPVSAQGSPASEAGRPPTAALISISAPDDQGKVTVSGAAGAVPPSTLVAVRNLYTGRSVQTTSGITGSFSATLYGPGRTPFWISAAGDIPFGRLDAPGSLPGGPGTIVYGSSAETFPATRDITALALDAAGRDWDAEACLSDAACALRNSESLYLLLADLPYADPDAQRLEVALSVDGAAYRLSLDVALSPEAAPQDAAWVQTAPRTADLGRVPLSAALSDTAAELRLPLDGLGAANAAELILLSATLLDEDDEALGTLDFGQTGAAVFSAPDQRDGIVYATPDAGRLGDDAQAFYVAGPAVQGGAYWWAAGRVSALDLAAGDDWALSLDVTLVTDNITLPVDLRVPQVYAVLTLQPAFAPGPFANNGWSNLLTPSGLAVDDLNGARRLAEASAVGPLILRDATSWRFGLRFDAVLPADLPPGIYVPTLHLQVGAAGDPLADWTGVSVLGGSADGPYYPPLARLPLTLQVGDVETTRLPWALLLDTPSQGSRGLLPDEDAGRVALSSRVRFNSAEYVLPPGTYPLEPYLPNLLPNRSDAAMSPLLPLLFPGGRLDATVTRPDGSVDALGGTPVVQNRLSTDADEERERFSPLLVDAYRLTTLVPAYEAYDFSAYGAYSVTLSGSVEDRWGRRYSGGGTYRVLIAEPLALQPGVLPGTPLESGDYFYPGLTVAPGFPAEVTVTLTLYPLDGGDPTVQTLSGTASDQGHFAPDEAFAIDLPQGGEYRVDYALRYTDAQGRLWAASQRAAGVIASAEAQVLAHGQRGIADPVPADAAVPAWYTLRSYPPGAPYESSGATLHAPYFSGDVAVYSDNSAQSGVQVRVQVQDLTQRYTQWLRDTLPERSQRDDFAQALRRQALPLLTLAGGTQPLTPALSPDLIANRAYAYVSVVQPGVTLRQYVLGGTDSTLPIAWDAEDVLNQQIGAGADGPLPNDYALIFGGALLSNAEAGLNSSAAYAALAVVGAEDGDLVNSRVMPPFSEAIGAGSTEPLLLLRGEPYDGWFVPTGTQPGQVLRPGEHLVIAGQAAPPLLSRVSGSITAPSGAVYPFDGTTNAIGYFFDPAAGVTVDAPGLWTVDLTVSPQGATSAGLLDPDLPLHNGVPGALNRRYTVYVVDADAPPLDWNRGGDLDTATQAGTLLNLTADVPAGWTNVQAYRSVRMPGYVLDDGPLRVSFPSAYQYSPPALRAEGFPVETTGRGSGASGSDVVTLVLAISGLDADGQPQLRTRSFTLLHDRLLSVEDE